MLGAFKTQMTPARKVDMTLPGKGNSNSEGARPSSGCDVSGEDSKVWRSVFDV